MREQPTSFRTEERSSLAQTVEALRDPASYPEPAGSVVAIETHMSWVFLTDVHAYKLKKPIARPTLDCTTVEHRRAACQLELELNRRLAADVYLAVVPLARAPAGLRVEGRGEAVEWLVKMRRLPQERMLDACIARGTVELADIDRLASCLAAFYDCAERTPMAAAAYRERIRADIAAKRASLERPRYGLVRADVLAAARRQTAWLGEHGPLLDARAACLVDAHGDMRPEHVCLEERPVVIDCLEFDRDLRLLDPLSELSFLALECRRLGMPWIGERLFARYTEHDGEPAPAALLAFYQSYHALVRAAVAIWHLDDDGLAQTERFRARAAAYLRLAQRLP